MSKRATFLSLAFVLVAASIQPGCGGSSGVTTPTAVPTPTPPPAPVKTVVVEGSFGGLKPFLIGDVPFTTTKTGTLDISVDWTFAEDHIIVYVAQDACSFEQLKASQCKLVAVSETTTPKPRTLSVQSAAAGGYVLWIGNLGPKQESVSYQVALTTVGGASVESQPATVEAQHTGEFVRDLRPW